MKNGYNDVKSVSVAYFVLYIYTSLIDEIIITT
jgi:hypothetical protein